MVSCAHIGRKKKCGKSDRNVIRDLAENVYLVIYMFLRTIYNLGCIIMLIDGINRRVCLMLSRLQLLFVASAVYPNCKRNV